MMSAIGRSTFTAWTLAFLAATLPALALTLPGDPSGGEAKALESARKRAKGHGNVAALAGMAADGEVRRATGVLAGWSPDGKSGYILTCAHTYYAGGYEARPTLQAMYPLVVMFGAENSEAAFKDGTSFMVEATRVILHPIPEPDKTGASAGEEAGSGMEAKAEKVRSDWALDQNAVLRDDLAVVEFPAAAAKVWLDRHGIKPAPLYPSGTAYNGHLAEGRVVGFGRFGTHSGEAMARSGLYRHAGNTRVVHITDGGWTGFLHGSRISPEGLKEDTGKAPRETPVRFLPDDPETSLALDEQGPVIRSGVAKAQGCLNPGDSGAPLFLYTKEGVLLGAIAQGTGQGKLWSASGAEVPGCLDYFVSLKERLPWIRAVLEGKPGASKVLEVGSRARPAGKVGTAVESKKQ